MTTFVIEHRCPQCGAPAVLEESDRLVKCQYCRVTSFLIRKDYFRYMFSHRAPESEQIFYVPYWRFKGVMFSSVSAGVKHRFMDVSYLAVRSHLFPISLGFRSQALKLKFAVPETAGRFLKPTFALEDAMAIFGRRFGKNLPQPVFHQEYIGETLSVIYSPYYVKDRLIDAVLNEPVLGKSADDFEPGNLPNGPPGLPLLFVAAICPGCGWDLEGERDSLVLVCRNCKTVWFPKGKSLKKIKFSTLDVPGSVFLPFWRIKVSIEGVELSSFADLVRIANLAKAPSPEHESMEFYFWSIAFKVPPQSFTRLNRNLTICQPQCGHSDELPAGPLHPVTLPAEEAVESMKITFAGFARPPEKYLPLLPSINISARTVKLFYIPFEEGLHEFIQEKFCLTINKNQIRLSSNL